MLLYNLRVVNTCIFSKLEILIFLSHQLTNSGTYWCAAFRTKRDDPLGTSSRTPLLRNLPFVGKVIWGFSVVAHIWAEITVKVELRKEFASHKMDGLKLASSYDCVLSVSWRRRRFEISSVCFQINVQGFHRGWLWMDRVGFPFAVWVWVSDFSCSQCLTAEILFGPGLLLRFKFPSCFQHDPSHAFMQSFEGWILCYVINTKLSKFRPRQL